MHEALGSISSTTKEKRRKTGAWFLLNEYSFHIILKWKRNVR
jgi:hypothetical protein